MQVRWAYLKRVLAGAIFGLYMAHLLYFLNPQVDIEPGRLATVTIVYGLICGFLFGSILWGLRAIRVRIFGRPPGDGPYRAHGFGFVVLAAFISGAIYWNHLYAFRIYLPIDAVRLLSKATNVITLTAFILLLLWALERNADRRASRTIFVAGVVLIAFSALFLYERRDRYHMEKRSVVVANVGTVAGQRPVIVLAVRSLPYDWIVTLTGEGALPFFEQARARDYFTRIEPFPTTSPKALWATLVTGKLPFRHGVTGRFSYRTPLNRSDPFLIVPSGVGFRLWGLIPPVQRISSQLPSGDALPFWGIFERLSLRTAVIDWPSATKGATRIVTEPMLRGGADPPELGAIASRFDNTGHAKPAIVAALHKDLAAVAAARQSLDARQFEVTAVALEGFSDAQRAVHVFNNDLPPASTAKGSAVRAYLTELDRIIAALARDYPDHLLVVVSPSGPEPPALPASAWSIVREIVTPVDPGADDGLIVMTGPDVAHKENAASALLQDVVPTLLFAAGLPVSQDMDGRVLIDAFDEDFLHRSTLSVIQTYEAQRIVVRRGAA